MRGLKGIIAVLSEGVEGRERQQISMVILGLGSSYINFVDLPG